MISEQKSVKSSLKNLSLQPVHQELSESDVEHTVVVAASDKRSHGNHIFVVVIVYALEASELPIVCLFICNEIGCLCSSEYCRDYLSFSARFSARAMNATESGFVPRAAGVPESPSSRMLWTSGIWPSSSMPYFSAIALPPSLPKM